MIDISESDRKTVVTKVVRATVALAAWIAGAKMERILIRLEHLYLHWWHCLLSCELLFQLCAAEASDWLLLGLDGTLASHGIGFQVGDTTGSFYRFIGAENACCQVQKAYRCSS